MDNRNVTITLLMYWSIAAALVVGGIFSLKKGFDLVLSGKGGAPQDNQISIFGLKASLGSLGALVMVTAFLWGYAASLTLPDYKDTEVQILSNRLSKAQEAVAQLSALNEQKTKSIMALTDTMANTNQLISNVDVMTVLTDQHDGKAFGKIFQSQNQYIQGLREANEANDMERLMKYSNELANQTPEFNEVIIQKKPISPTERPYRKPQ